MIDLDAIEARANATPEGPWHAEDDDGDGPGFVSGPSREFIAETYNGEGSGRLLAEAVTGGPETQHVIAAFIAAARTDVPALVAHVRALHAAVRELAAADAVFHSGETVIGADVRRVEKAIAAVVALVPEAKA